jgi:hypothetical protein
MLAFAPLSDQDAIPIFKPYLDGLAFIAKSDIFYSFDALARRAFIASLAGALRRYGDWDGKPGSFKASYHAAFLPFMPDIEHRDRMFPALTPEGDSSDSALVNLRSAKQLADLYLIHVASREVHRRITATMKTEENSAKVGKGLPNSGL